MPESRLERARGNLYHHLCCTSISHVRLFTLAEQSQSCQRKVGEKLSCVTINYEHTYKGIVVSLRQGLLLTGELRQQRDCQQTGNRLIT